MKNLLVLLCVGVCACVNQVNEEDVVQEVDDDVAVVETQAVPNTSGNFNPCLGAVYYKQVSYNGYNTTIRVPAYCNPNADPNPPDPNPVHNGFISKVNPAPDLNVNITR